MTTPKLALPELLVGQSGKELTHNQALAILSQLTQANVVDKDLTAPPGSPVDGAMYLVATSATGDWLGKDGQLAFWLASVAAWTFAVPVNGWRVWVTDEAEYYKLKAGVWAIDTSGGGSGMTNPMTTVGDLVVGGTSGTPARLAASTASYVLTSNGAGVAPTWQESSGGVTLSVVQTFTGAKTLALADINTYNVSQDATAQTVTLPAQATVAWTANAEITVERGAAGALTIVGAAGVAINGVTAGTFTLGAQYSVATLKRKASNSWTIFGNAS